MGHRLLQRCLVFYVDARARAVNLTNKPAEHLARANLHKVLHAKRCQRSHGLVPLHRARYLAYERIARLVGGCDQDASTLHIRGTSGA